MIAHHRKVRAARHAHPHDCGDLRNSHRGHYRVIAEDAPKIVGVWKNIFLERQEYSRGIDKINCGNSVFDGDVLRANHFLRGHGEKRAGFHGCIIGDNHEGAPANFGKSGDRPRARRAAPFLVHFERRVDSQFKKLRTGIDQLCDALAGGETAFFVLRFDGLRATALADLFFFVLDFCQQIDDAAGVLFEFGRFQIRSCFQNGIRHAKPSRTSDL